MAMYPPEIRRCQHLRTNGTQCGSPALRNQALCYFHRESQPERVKVASENGKPCRTILVPVFEDAYSIQTMVRQVTILLLEGKIDSKKAGQVLYALQIASANLKRMELEKPRPVQVVVDEKKVAKTPLGMTPWTANEGGSELDEPVDIAAERALREVEGAFKYTHEYIRGRIADRLQAINKWQAENQGPHPVGLSNFLQEMQENLQRIENILDSNLRTKIGGWPVRRCEHLPPEVG